MTKKQQKEIIGLTAILAFIPLTFFVLGLINLFADDDREQALGFLISAGVFAVIAVIIIAIELYRFRQINSARTNQQRILAIIDRFEEEDGVLNLETHYVEGNQRYSFSALYEAKNPTTITQIQNRLANQQQPVIKVIVDLNRPKHFEFQIDDFLQENNIDARLDQLANSYQVETLSSPQS